MKKVVTVTIFDLARCESASQDSRMPLPLDSLSLPKNATALRALLRAREQEHAAELEAARNGLKDQALQIEQLKARLAKLLRQRFGSSSEKLRGQIDQLQLMIGDLEEEYASRHFDANPRRSSAECSVRVMASGLPIRSSSGRRAAAAYRIKVTHRFPARGESQGFGRLV